MYRLGAKSVREVTVDDQVEEWWKNSTRLAKKSNVVEKEERCGSILENKNRNLLKKYRYYMMYDWALGVFKSESGVD